MKKRIAILASGAGSNAKAIIEHFGKSAIAEIALVASNRKDAGVLDIANQNQIPTKLITKENFFSGESFLEELLEQKIDFIVLAGFLAKVPASIIARFPNHIVNIHPALLPKHGGKGMYGHFVHEAVFAAREKESGITIHFVNENYDEGAIIFQAKVALDENDTPQTIEQKVRQLELKHYATVVESLLS